MAQTLYVVTCIYSKKRKNPLLYFYVNTIHGINNEIVFDLKFR